MEKIYLEFKEEEISEGALEDCRKDRGLILKERFDEVRVEEWYFR